MVDSARDRKQSEHARTDVHHKLDFDSIVCRTLGLSNANRDLRSLSERTGQPAQEAAYLARDRLSIIANKARNRTVFLFLRAYLLVEFLAFKLDVYVTRDETKNAAMVRGQRTNSLGI